MANVALLTDQDTESNEDRNKVTLMTMHSAKGLEFKHVYIVGMEDTLFPSPMSSGSARELEEERRLFYVAVTRAEKQATLSYALNRYKWGNLERCSPSRFLKEIDQKFLHYPQTGGKPFQNNIAGIKPASLREEPRSYPKDDRFKKMVKSEQAVGSSFAGSDSSLFSEGDRVQHERFGTGTIKSIEGQPPNTTATVEFDKEGSKKLLLRFAKLKKLDA
jgi:DNA helicase-2/ATP-dependent DNA helicase PcrA